MWPDWSETMRWFTSRMDERGGHIKLVADPTGVDAWHVYPDGKDERIACFKRADLGMPVDMEAVRQMWRQMGHEIA